MAQLIMFLTIMTAIALHPPWLKASAADQTAALQTA
jgi:hypothetical protein